jgi:hypothetical protein
MESEEVAAILLEGIRENELGPEISLWEPVLEQLTATIEVTADGPDIHIDAKPLSEGALLAIGILVHLLAAERGTTVAGIVEPLIASLRDQT